MATTHTKNAVPPIESAFERANEAGDHLFAAARKAGNLYLDSYEKTVERAIELELKVAGVTQQEWLRNLIEAQTDFARELAGTYAATARTLLK